MCKYCKENENGYTKDLLISTDERAFICDDTLGWLWMNEQHSDSRQHIIKINYCPMCGEQLIKGRF